MSEKLSYNELEKRIHELEQTEYECRQDIKELKASEAIYRKMFEAGSDAVFMIDNETGSILKCNQAATDLYKYSMEELHKLTNRDLSSEPDDTKKITKTTLPDPGTVIKIPIRWHRKKDGTRFPVEIYGRFFIQDDRSVHIASIRDISERLSTENDLLNERNFVNKLIDSLPGIFYLFTVEGKFLRWNKNLEKLSDYSADEISTKTPLDFFPPEEQALVEKRIGEVFTKGESYVEANWLSKNGNQTPHYLTGVLVDFNGIPCQVGMGIDISKRKKIENALRESEEITRSIIVSSPAPIQLLDKEGFTLKVNSAHTKMFGSRPPSDYTVLNDPILKKTGFQNDILRVSQGEIVHFPDMYYNPHDLSPDLPNKPVWATGVGFPLFDSEGNVKNIVLMHQNITERKKAEEALRKSNKELFQARSYLEAVIDNANVWLNVVDSEGNVVIWNKAAEQISGYSRDEVIGNSKIWEWSYPDKKYREEITKKASGIIETANEIENLETTIRTKNNKQKVISWHSRHLVDENDNPIGSIAFGRDVTTTKLLETQLAHSQKMESVGRLAGGVAHDFNNMLGVILGNVELAKANIKMSSPIQMELSEIEEATLRSADLTRQLLGFARKQTVIRKILNINSVISKILEMLQRVIGENIELIWKPDTELWKIKVDPGQIDQIFTNLLVNARDAIESHGMVTIETTNCIINEDYADIHKDIQPGEYVMLSISDSGHGMDDETQENIFEPFYTTKPQGEGTGLGLSNVYGIVKQNYGFINVNSELNQGTTFKIYLPRCYEKHPAKDIIPITKEPERGTETILVVEDEKSILEISTLILESLGYVVLSAGTPSIALEKAEGYPDNIDLLITDIMMPEMSGRDLAKSIYNMYPDIQILYMSGYTANMIARDGEFDNNMKFIQKPFTKNQLSTQVRNLLGKSY